MQLRYALGVDGVAQAGRQRVDGPAFDAAGRHQRFAAHGSVAARQRHALQRLALEAAAERLRPCNEEAAIGRPQRRHADALGGQQRRPVAGRAEPRPARAAERQHGRVGGDDLVPVRRDEYQTSGRVPSAPAAARAEGDAGAGEARQPGAQQRRGFHRFRKNAAAGADERRLPERFAPGAHRLRRQRLDGRQQAVPRAAVARQEIGQLLAVGEVEAAAPGQQELPPERGHAVVDRDAGAAGGQHLGRHQSGGPAPDHGDAATRVVRHRGPR